MASFERLLNKVLVDDEGCWNYTGALSDGGYGFFWLNGTNVYAHRASWEFHCEPIPVDMCVLHRCDNRRCINPEHLFVGTYQDNMDDMKAKNRQANTRGELNAYASINESTARKIKELLTQGERKVHIAHKLNVSYHTVKNIAYGKAWSWL